MGRILIFGGTTEGRKLAEYCSERGICADVSVTTVYGAGLLPDTEHIRVFTGKKDCSGIEAMITVNAYSMVIDATHPFAEAVSAALRSACLKHGVRYIRVLRESLPLSGRLVKDMDGLISYLNERRSKDSGLRILSTLGGKSLPQLKGIRDFREYVYARVLPLDKVLREAEKLGFPGDHIIAEKGPFSVERNIAHIRRCRAGVLLTKESGAEGGYPQKAEAAAVTGIELVTLLRPCEEGVLYDEALHIIDSELA